MALGWGGVLRDSCEGGVCHGWDVLVELQVVRFFSGYLTPLFVCLLVFSCLGHAFRVSLPYIVFSFSGAGFGVGDRDMALVFWSVLGLRAFVMIYSLQLLLLQFYSLHFSSLQFCSLQNYTGCDSLLLLLRFLPLQHLWCCFFSCLRYLCGVCYFVSKGPCCDLSLNVSLLPVFRRLFTLSSDSRLLRRWVILFLTSGGFAFLRGVGGVSPWVQL